jgi:MoaA/NifB/PqqE/SkfB family radical SAM enzyme
MSNTKYIDIFSADEHSMVDFFEYTNSWSEQYMKAVERELVPQILNAPLFALWEITSKCPQSCIYCYNKSPRQSNELSSYRLFKLADELIAAGIFRICLSGGEPNMNPDYLNLVSYLSSGGMNVGTVISGWGMDAVKIRFLCRHADTIQVSLDGSTEEIHDSIRRRKGSYQDAVNSIRLLSDAGKRPMVATSLVKKNAQDFPKLYELCCKMGVYELRSQYLANVGRAKDGECEFADKEDYEAIKKFVDEVKSNPGPTKVSFSDPTIHITNGYKLGYCSLVRITPEGNVGISPYLDIFFGNVLKEPLSEIFRQISPAYLHPDIRKLIESGELGLADGIISFNSDKPLFITGCVTA